LPFLGGSIGRKKLREAADSKKISASAVVVERRKTNQNKFEY